MTFVEEPAGVREAFVPALQRAARLLAELVQRLSRSWMAAPLLVGVLVLTYHSWNMTLPGAWRDEGATMSAIDRTWSSLFELLGNVDAVHGLYYMLMKLWTSIVGFGVTQVRVVSVLATTATAMILVVVGRRLSSTWFGACAGLAFALIPRAAWSALEARSPALATLLLLVAVIALLRALERDRVRDWVFFGLSVAGALSIFLYNAFGLVALIFLMVGVSRFMWIRAAIAGAAGVLVCLPLIQLARVQSTQVAWLAHAPEASVLDRLPPLFTMNSWEDSYPWLLIAFAVTGTVCLLTGRIVLRMRRARAAGLILGLAALPWLVPVLIAFFSQNVYTDRYASPATTGLALLIASFVAAIRPRWVGLMLIAVLLVAAMPSWLNGRSLEGKEGSLQVAEYVARDKQPGDGVIYFLRRSAEDWVQRSNQFPGHLNSLETTKVAAISYPDRFSGLIDLTEERPARETGGLFEERGPLVAHLDRLEDVDRVWLIRFKTVDQGQFDSDRETLSQAGFAASGESVTHEPYHVELWTRQS